MRNIGKLGGMGDYSQDQPSSIKTDLSHHSAFMLNGQLSSPHTTIDITTSSLYT